MSDPTVHPMRRRRARRAWERRVWSRLGAHSALVYALAWIWRRLLFRTTFVAVTGSHGKSTAKECLAEMLATRAATVRTEGNQNDELGVCVSVLRARPWHRFAVLELSGAGPGHLRRSARLVRPDVGIVLNVLHAHSKALPTHADRVAEKRQLFAALRPGGLAIVNGDDPTVAAMPVPPGVRTLTFGASAAFDLWADEAMSRWPDRFGFRAHRGEESVRVQTQLVGTHWLTSVLAALAAATACGVPLAQAAAAAGRVAPFPARLEPLTLANGAVVLRDDYHGSIDTFDAACRVLAEARATRRLLVVQDVSDSGMSTKQRLRRIATEAARCSEVALFVGENAAWTRRRAIDAGMNPDAVHAVASPGAAAELLRAELRRGDVALLKGRTTDHLARVAFALTGAVGCRRTRCRMNVLCDFCSLLEFRPDPAR